MLKIIVIYVNGSEYTTVEFIVVISCLTILKPFLAGFYSKDLILEITSFRYLNIFGFFLFYFFYNSSEYFIAKCLSERVPAEKKHCYMIQIKFHFKFYVLLFRCPVFLYF